MNKKDFLLKYYKYAKACEIKTRVPALFILAQCAVETGWAEHAPGNMMFGIKDTDGINGNEQLITTTEYLKNPNAKFPVVISKTWIEKIKRWKYIVKDYFRKYNTPEESFNDHAMFFIKNKRYQDNFIKCGTDPYKWADEVASDGYATGVTYARLLKAVIESIEKGAKSLKLI